MDIHCFCKTSLYFRVKKEVTAFLKSKLEIFGRYIKAVAMDRSRSYSGSVLQALPSDKSVIDRFHISQLIHKLVDDARKHIQNKIRKEKGDTWRYENHYDYELCKDN
jgi:transposase